MLEGPAYNLFPPYTHAIINSLVVSFFFLLLGVGSMASGHSRTHVVALFGGKAKMIIFFRNFFLLLKVKFVN